MLQFKRETIGGGKKGKLNRTITKLYKNMIKGISEGASKECEEEEGEGVKKISRIVQCPLIESMKFRDS